MQLGQNNTINTCSLQTPVPGTDRFNPGCAQAPTLRDIGDALNPLEHIPFVSTLYDQWTGHTPSSGSQMIGGALLGGPIGFAASLVDVVFKQQTGKPVGEAMVAALTGGGGKSEAATQVADASATQHAAETAVEAQTQAANALADANDTQQAVPTDEVAVITPTSQEVLPPIAAGVAAPATLASTAPTGKAAAGSTAVLDLYGGSASANRAYQRAQLRPYLQAVNQGLVL